MESRTCILILVYYTGKSIFLQLSVLHKTPDVFLYILHEGCLLDFHSLLANTVSYKHNYKEYIMKNRTCFLCLLTGIVIFLFSACGAGEKNYTDYSQYLRPSSGNSSSQVPASAPADDFSSAVTVVSTPLPGTPAPVNTPSPTPVPGPFSSPATPSPTPQPTPIPNMVQITTSPTSETVQEGGSAVFIAYADNSTGIVWITVSPDARSSYDINNAYTVFPSLQVSGQGTSVLTLSNIPYEMDGWRIQAYFTGNGGPLYTAGAYLTVIQAAETAQRHPVWHWQNRLTAMCIIRHPLQDTLWAALPTIPISAENPISTLPFPIPDGGLSASSAHGIRVLTHTGTALYMQWFTILQETCSEATILREAE